MALAAGGNFGNGGGKGPSKKELDEFGEDEDNMLGKAEVLLCAMSYVSQAHVAQLAYTPPSAPLPSFCKPRRARAAGLWKLLCSASVICTEGDKVTSQAANRLRGTHCKELSPLQAEELCRAKGIELPQDFLEAAMDNGLRTIVLEEYIRLQVGGLKWLLRHAILPACITYAPACTLT